MIRDYCNVMPKAHEIPGYDMKSSTDWYGVKAIKDLK